VTFSGVSYEEAMRRAREIVPTLRERAQKLEARYGLPFGRYVSKLRHMNRCTPQELLIHAA